MCELLNSISNNDYYKLRGERVNEGEMERGGGAAAHKRMMNVPSLH